MTYSINSFNPVNDGDTIFLKFLLVFASVNRTSILLHFSRIPTHISISAIGLNTYLSIIYLFFPKSPLCVSNTQLCSKIPNSNARDEQLLDLLSFDELVLIVITLALPNKSLRVFKSLLVTDVGKTMEKKKWTVRKIRFSKRYPTMEREVVLCSQQITF